MKEIPKGKTIVVAFSGGESSAKALELVLKKYKETHKIIVCFCNTGEEDEETFIFSKKIAEYFNIEVIWLEYESERGFNIVDFETAYRITDWEEENEYPNHPFHKWVKDYGLPQYPERTCTREMKERTITRYLSSIKEFPRFCTRVVGIRFDEIAKRKPDKNQYYPLILEGVTKPYLNRYFEYEMPFRLQLPSYLGNCGACISKSLRNLCTIARERPRKFKFFKFLSDKYGEGKHTFYNKFKTVDDIFEMAKDESIKSAKDNRFNLAHQQDLFFDSELDSEGACGGVCEAFS
ncbi:phosphoadenosine phosphosulfate reductase family protein [Flavobacterium macrobrachii]|uniref:Phosphoadenosine phosphosulfate reductase family protein n=2 Tax=Flavobacterium macrobrachii TaxID=591204 RepID=A0ABS2CSL6_9FLAO|nr:phosphoadenosine phosphosulfate reductase family protein [Flavobacterium macrobrachii]MBM6497938.1 phosphoadenosine phosphosulfate reductase family protein [Flavobacterium macrobrachii]